MLMRKIAQAVGLVAALALFGLAAENLLPGWITSQDGLSAEEVAQQVQDIVIETIQVGTNTLNEQIHENIEKLKALREMVAQAEHPDQVLDAVVRQLDELARSFEEMAQVRPEVSTAFQDGLEDLGRLGERSAKTISELKAKMEQLRAELQDLAFESDERIREIRQKALETRLELVRIQRDLWEALLDKQRQIAQRLRDMSENVRVFMALLAENALVYREGADTARVYRDLRQAAQILETVEDVDDLITKLEESWQILLELIQDLVSTGLISEEAAGRMGKLETGWVQTLRTFDQMLDHQKAFVASLHQRLAGN
jgi:DNA repair exonuclease SbcCD ATPase subunit